MDPQDPIRTHQLMLDVAEQELGIQPILSSVEMASMAEPNRLGLITYLSQFYEAFKPPPPGVNCGVGYPTLSPSWDQLGASHSHTQYVPVPSVQHQWSSARSRCPLVAPKGPSSFSASCRRASSSLTSALR